MYWAHTADKALICSPPEKRTFDADRLSRVTADSAPPADLQPASAIPRSADRHPARGRTGWTAPAREGPIKQTRGRIGLRFSFEVLRLDDPFGIDAQAAIRAPEQQRRLFVALKLPVQPRHRDTGEFAAIRLVVGATVPDAPLPRAEHRDRLDVFEIGIGVIVRDI